MFSNAVFRDLLAAARRMSLGDQRKPGIRASRSTIVVPFSAPSAISGWAVVLVFLLARLSFAQTEAATPGEAASNALDAVVEQLPQVMASRESDAPATDRGEFRTLPGYEVERLFEVPQDTHGSWVSMAFDFEGRITVSDQGQRGLFRITPPPRGSGQPTRVEPLKLSATSAQGLLYAFDRLYLSINGDGDNGLYCATDRDGDGQWEDLQPLLLVNGGGEHGPHSLRLGPDGKSIYWIAGNHTDPPSALNSTRMLRNWNEDLLLPRQWDARGHARGRLAPGGWIVRTDPDGKQAEMFSIGFRNAYDLDFNPDGELFAYDADMEWDFGTPWYRPTRVLHAVSGSEFGWRSGTGKWPAWYLDSLPPVVEIGPGSPTGVVFGTGARFPAKYQRALYLLDWTFGTIYAVHLRPTGASYVGDKEEFLARTALPLTDAAIGPDGALYFLVGGRGTQSALYRVSYVGPAATDPVDGFDALGAEQRALRHQLEMAQPQAAASTAPVDTQLIVSVLNHEDRFIRYAARTALEWQPWTAEWLPGDQGWRQSVLRNGDPVRRIQGAVALAHTGNLPSTQADPALRTTLLAEVLESLRGIDVDRLPDPLRLDLLRAYSLAFIRLAPPSAEQAAQVITQMAPLYPDGHDDVNRELVNVLVYLNAPGVVQQTMTLLRQPTRPPRVDVEALLARNPQYGDTITRMISNPPEVQKLHYAFVLRNVRYGWTLEERKQYFAWLDEARKRSGGASYEGFIDNIRADAMANLSADEQAALASETPPAPPTPAELPAAQGPGRSRTLDEVVDLVQSGLHDRDYAQGQRTFAAARCVVCHRFDGRGGATGPDLSSVAGRFSVRDLADAMLQPSRIVSDQYRATLLHTHQGQVITGRIIGETDTEWSVQTNPEDARQVETVAKADVDHQQPSPTSAMPEKLLETLNDAEVCDLFAFLLSRGNERDVMFLTRPEAAQ